MSLIYRFQVRGLSALWLRICFNFSHKYISPLNEVNKVGCIFEIGLLLLWIWLE